MGELIPAVGIEPSHLSQRVSGILRRANILQVRKQGAAMPLLGDRPADFRSPRGRPGDPHQLTRPGRVSCSPSSGSRRPPSGAALPPGTQAADRAGRPARAAGDGRRSGTPVPPPGREGSCPGRQGHAPGAIRARLFVPNISSTSCDQAIFADPAAGASVSSDAAAGERCADQPQAASEDQQPGGTWARVSRRSGMLLGKPARPRPGGAPGSLRSRSRPWRGTDNPAADAFLRWESAKPWQASCPCYLFSSINETTGPF